MKTYAQRHLLSISQEIADTSAELGMLRERLHQEASTLEDVQLRTLIAETPQADRDLQRAAGAIERLRGLVVRLEAELRSLRAQEARLVGERRT
jgi:predicted  nucleic acid-binding Zn-ribbon protein